MAISNVIKCVWNIEQEYKDLILNGFRKFYCIGGGDYYSCLIYYKEKEKEITGNSIIAKKNKLEMWYEATLKLPLS